jgi:hypothetical protein
MSANVTTYVIFITFATIIAAPVLFALSSQLLLIIESLVVGISRPAGGAAASFATAFSTLAIKPDDFHTFAVTMLTITSFFSASIVAIIRRGSIKGGFKYIPTFIIIAVMLFYIANLILSRALGGMIVL